METELIPTELKVLYRDVKKDNSFSNTNQSGLYGQVDGWQSLFGVCQIELKELRENKVKD